MFRTILSSSSEFRFSIGVYVYVFFCFFKELLPIILTIARMNKDCYNVNDEETVSVAILKSKIHQVLELGR